MKKNLQKSLTVIFLVFKLVLIPLVIYSQGFQSANVGPEKYITIGTSTLIGNTSISGHTYLWSPATDMSSATEAQPEVWPSVTTKFYLTETEVSTSIQHTDSVVVIVRPYPYAVTANDTIICLGQELSFGSMASPGMIYNWVPSTGLNSVTSSRVTARPTETITYYLTVTDTLTTVSSMNTITIEVLQAPLADAGTDHTFCLGGSAKIGVPALSGVSYNWLPNNNITNPEIAEPTVTPALSTAYILTMTDSVTGCISTDTTLITVNSLPDANTGSDLAICFNEKVSIGANGLASNKYQWTFDSSLSAVSIANPIAAPLSNTTYHLTETDTATGCKNSNDITVTVNPLPDAFTGPDKTICFGEGVFIGVAAVPGNTYNWDSVAGLNDYKLAEPLARPDITTEYFITETISATGCHNTNSVVITVNPLPEANAGTDQTVCAGKVTTIGNETVNTNTFRWTPAEGLSSASVAKPTVNIDSTTIFTLTETNPATGCANSNQVTVTIIPQLSAPSVPEGESDFCQYNKQSIYTTDSIEGAANYIWTLSPVNAGDISGNGTTLSVNWNENFNGLATVKVAGQNNCGIGTLSNGLDVFIKAAPPTPSITLKKRTLSSDAPYGNQWYNESGAIEGATNQFFNPTVKGMYYTKVSQDDCISKPSNSQYFEPGINNPNNINTSDFSAQVQVYPNPNNGLFNIQIPVLINETVNLTIVNSIGKIVFQKNQITPNVNTALQINLHELIVGVYFINIHSERFHSITKMVISR